MIDSVSLRGSALFDFGLLLLVMLAKVDGRSDDPYTVLRGHLAGLNVVEFWDTEYLVSGDCEGHLKLWNLETRRAVTSKRVHERNSGVLNVALHGRKNHLISQGRDGQVKCWELTESGISGEPTSSIETGSFHFCKFSVVHSHSRNETTEMRVSESDSLVAIAGNDPAIAEVWDIESGKKALKLNRMASCQTFLTKFGQDEPPNAGMCMSLFLYKDPKTGNIFLLSGYEDGSLALWDLRFPSSPLMSAAFHKEPVLSCILDKTFEGGVSSSAGNNLVFFKLEHDEASLTVRHEEQVKEPGIEHVALRQDDRIVATAGWDNRVRIFDFKKKKPLASLRYHSAGVSGVAFSGDGKILASCSKDHTIALWTVFPPKQ